MNRNKLILFIFCSLFALILLSMLAVPVGAQPQAATATAPAPTQEGATAELVSENPYGPTLTLVLSDVFPDDVVSYYGDGSPTPSGSISTDEPVEYTLGAGEYISCAGGGFNATDEFTRDDSPLVSVFPMIEGAGSVTYINRGAPVTFVMSANVGTWCTRGLLMGSVTEAATRLAGKYVYALLTQALPETIQVETHVLVNTNDGEYHWSGIIDATQLVLTEQSGQGGGAVVGLTDWSTAVLINPDGGPTTWPVRLDTTVFNTVQTETDEGQECLPEINDVNTSCTTQPEWPTYGNFVLRSGIGFRATGDSIGIFDETGEHLLIARPQEGVTDWWFVLNDSTEDLNLLFSAPYGSDRQYFEPGNFSSWTLETIDLMYRNGMRQFLAPETTVTSVSIPTPMPNCVDFEDGCDRTNVRSLVYTGNGIWIVLYYGVASEFEPFWTPVLPVPPVDWPAVNG